LLALVHAKGGSLDDQDIFVFIDDKAAKEIAFSVDDPEGSRVWQMLLSNCQRRTYLLLKEALVYFDTVRREDANIYL
jgi:hypothetical protein